MILEEACSFLPYIWYGFHFFNGFLSYKNFNLIKPNKQTNYKIRLIKRLSSLFKKIFRSNFLYKFNGVINYVI